MPSFTREQLRNFTTNSANFTGDLNFTFVNNASTVGYFTLFHKENDPIFDSASISSLVNCSMMEGSSRATFIMATPSLIGGFDTISGSLLTTRNALLPSLSGSFSGSKKDLTATSLEAAFTSVSSSITDLTATKLLNDFTSVSGSAGTYTSVSSSNTNLTAS